MACAANYHVDTLPQAEKTQYKEKLSLINNSDPYNIPRAEWKCDVSLLLGFPLNSIAV